MALAGYGKEHTNDLTKQEAAELITKLSAMTGFKQQKKQTSKYQGHGRRGSQIHLSDIQAERIAILEDKLGWNEARTAGFITRQTGKAAAVRMLMNYEAVKVIVGMTRILAGGNRALFLGLNKSGNNELRVFNN